ncbi:MAG: hypothetical protein ACOX4U_06315 [Anaerovoracaceae bacterium]|jgi:hypothetical protein
MDKDDFTKKMVEELGKVPMQEMPDQLKKRISYALSQEGRRIKDEGKALYRRRIYGIAGALTAAFAVGFISISMYNDVEKDYNIPMVAHEERMSEHGAEEDRGLTEEKKVPIKGKEDTIKVAEAGEREYEEKEPMAATETRSALSCLSDEEVLSNGREYYMELLREAMAETPYTLISYEEKEDVEGCIIKVSKENQVITFLGAYGELKVVEDVMEDKNAQ